MKDLSCFCPDSIIACIVLRNTKLYSTGYFITRSDILHVVSVQCHKRVEVILLKEHGNGSTNLGLKCFQQMGHLLQRS